MAEDARISTALPRHPKTVKLFRRLKERGCWHLICLFLWVAENRSDGDLQGLTNEDVEIAAGWSAQPGVFVSALTEVGFLDGEEGKLVVHDWAEHNPWAASRGLRIAAARTAANHRWDKHRRQVVLPSDAASMPLLCDPHAEGCADSMLTTQPNPTPPSPAKKQSDVGTPVDWIPEESWKGFVEMRKKMRAPLTDRAKVMMVKKLEQLSAHGNDVGEVLDQSTRNSWKDVYELKGPNGNGANSGHRKQGGAILAQRTEQYRNKPAHVVVV